eukprot:4020341-Amphidinium_carterae.1
MAPGFACTCASLTAQLKLPYDRKAGSLVISFKGVPVAGGLCLCDGTLCSHFGSRVQGAQPPLQPPATAMTRCNAARRTMVGVHVFGMCMSAPRTRQLAVAWASPPLTTAALLVMVVKCHMAGVEAEQDWTGAEHAIVRVAALPA